MKAHTMTLTAPRAWVAATLFVAGNIVLPQLAHLIPQGGLMLLPIYFFTLVGAWMCGWQVGLLTAIVSPLVNSLLFGMPATGMLPIIMMKGVLLAGAASYAAHRTGRVSLVALLAVVLSYQTVGCAIESVVEGSLAAGYTDFRIGLPGLALQVVGGYIVLRLLTR